MSHKPVFHKLYLNPLFRGNRAFSNRTANYAWQYFPDPHRQLCEIIYIHEGNLPESREPRELPESRESQAQPPEPQAKALCLCIQYTNTASRSFPETAGFLFFQYFPRECCIFPRAVV